MRHFTYQMLSISLLLALSTPAYCQNNKGNSLDVNLNNANVNFNPINNNKYSTELRTFTPGNVAPGQIDLSGISTPPTTGTVKTFAGGWINSDVVDADVSNAKEAEELKRKTGKYYAKPIESIADDAPVDSGDIQDFLKSYYHYLRDSGLNAGSIPVVPQSSSGASNKKSSIKKSSSGLLAKEQKLITGKLPTAK